MIKHVIWKRPDGFQNACPEDFRKISLSNGAQLWLHKYELEWYPFQVSGDWSGQEDTKKLNRFVNMLDATKNSWKSMLEHLFDDDLNSKEGRCAKEIAEESILWIKELESSLKGDSWELEIVRCAFYDILQKLNQFH